jgi:hypothetical protein
MISTNRRLSVPPLTLAIDMRALRGTRVQKLVRVISIGVPLG